MIKSFSNYILYLTLKFAKKRGRKILHGTYKKNVQLAFIYRLAFVLFFSAMFILINLTIVFDFKSDYLGYFCVLLFLMTMFAVVFEPLIDFNRIEKISFKKEEIRKNQIILWTIISLAALRCALPIIFKN